MPKKSKIDEIEEIGANLPKSEKTKDFIKKVQAQSDDKKETEAKPKREKAKVKAEKEKPEKAPKKAKEPEPVKKAPPLRVRVEIPEGEIGLLNPDELDNTQFQPRAAFAETGTLQVPPELVRNIRRHRGNIQAILAVKTADTELLKKGIKAVVIDGHRRVAAIRRINLEEPKQQLKVKAEIIEVDPAEAAVIALDVNLDAERLSESERDKWIYSLMHDHGMTDDQIAQTTGLAKPTLSNIRRVFEQAPKQVIELLEKGEVSTGHIKAVVSLPDSDQKRIIKKAAKKDLSVRDVETEAKYAKDKELVVEKIMDFLTGKYKDTKTGFPAEIAVPNVQAFYGSVVKDAFTNGTEGALARYGYWPSDANVRTALRRLGLKVVEVQPAKEGVEKPEPKTPLCTGCVAYVESRNKCLWTASDHTIRPPKFGECPMFLAGRAYSRQDVNVCPHCNMPVWRPDIGVPPLYKSMKDAVHVSGVGSYRFNDPAVKGETTTWAHTWCLFNYLAKQNNITGVCLDCNNEHCAFMEGVSQMGPHMKGTIHVKSCEKQSSGFEIEKYNQETREAWLEAMKAQEPEPETKTPEKEEPPEVTAKTTK